jgi:N-acetyl sugar amidotransferase
MLVRCKECLMPTTRPDTAFENGVCSACISFKARAEIDWDRRVEDLLNLLESAKVSPDGYHCVVPSSGGKDSHWQVLKLIELGVRPLVVTATTCMLTEIGKANIRNLARYATTVEITPNLRVRAMLNRLGLELVGDISWPEHVSIFHAPWRIAKMHEIPLMFYGECPQNAYGGPMDALDARQMTRRWITEFGGHLGLRPADLVGQYGIRREDMADYMMPADVDGIEAHFLGAYYPWDSHRNARAAVSAGMQTDLPTNNVWWAFENLDNAQTGIHDYFGFLKFGYNRCCAQISVDIRYGMISRQEAAEVVRQCDWQFPEVYGGLRFDRVLDHIEMPMSEFLNCVWQYANPDLFDLPRRDDGPTLPCMKPEIWDASFC